ncbi:MAG TPA: FmdB family zinc ribbon protein [Acidimicrobiales bacterium]|nr:FmdB family zinc ribbon protein [Acidimicrobiales bacterium]
MPTYEYACKACGEHLEVVQSFKDDALTTCPACGGPLRKVFGSIGIAFKGSGFYRTDSRSGPATKEKADKADKADKGEKKAAASSEGSSSPSSSTTEKSSSSGDKSSSGAKGGDKGKSTTSAAASASA